MLIELLLFWVFVFTYCGGYMYTRKNHSVRNSIIWPFYYGAYLASKGQPFVDFEKE